jgi:threonine dehydratase
VIAGQGTIGLELADDLHQYPGLTLIVPVGGGGLLAGIGAAMEHVSYRPRIVGVCADASRFMHALFWNGNQDGVPDLPTLADGLSGVVEEGSLTIPMVQKYAADMITVSEFEISQAIAFAWRKYGQKVEGSGAVGLAAVLAGKVDPPAVVIVSGGNIDPDIHQRICQENQVV